MQASLYTNLPVELRLLPNWVLWRLEYPNGIDKKPTKRPYQLNGQLASVTDPNHWSSFEDCFNVLQMGNYSGLGFVFTNSDYTGIDLDEPEGDASVVERQLKVFNEFDSYSEISPSGRGLHIIVKGAVPTGRRRSKIELYSTGRFFTMTGNVYNNKPIVERQELLNQLWEQMGGAPMAMPIVTDGKEEYTDDVIIERAKNAVNGDKFAKLYEGNWREVFPHIPLDQGPSEADFALVDMIAFYTQNLAQISRIFYSSALGKRDKVKRKDYMLRMINRSFDNQPLPVDFDGLHNAIVEKLNGAVAQRSEPFAHNGLVAGSNPASPTNLAASYNGNTTAFDAVNLGSIPNAASKSKSFNYTPPPGLMGEIAQFIYDASPRQAVEISLAAAIGLMAGICGKAYNISGTGLNMYVLTLAKTGRGKEAAASGIDKLMNAIRMQVPTSARFIGPGIINSGQSLIKHLNHTSDCFLSVLGEFGITIERISSPFASSADKALYQNLLDLYNKSGHGQSVKASIYSKKEDSTTATMSPAVSILGESTHKLFYGALNEDMISAGLLPRFLIIEYNGQREYLNKNSHLVQPSFQLIEKLASLAAHCETTIHAQKVVNVQTDELAQKMLDNLDKTSTDNINSAHDDVIAELWNRAHMKVLRLSSLIAVGTNPYNPVILPSYVEWSLALVTNDINSLSSRFEAGEVGKHTGETKQVKEVIRMINDYHKKDWDYIKKYSKSEKMYKAGVIPLTYFSSRLSGLNTFNDGRVKASVAINQTLQTLCDRDSIREVPKPQLAKDFGTSQKCYIIHDMDLLL